MKYRKLGTTELDVSEVGFGVRTVSTNWWGKIEEADGIRLMQRAHDIGISYFDTADAYGEGYGEEILAKALRGRRNDIVIGTKFGYDFYNHVRREGHQERPQNFTPEFIRLACERSLKRLGTDYIDLYQIHNPRVDAIEKDDLFDTLDQLVREGKIRHHGVAVGPDIGWYEEGEASIRDRHTRAMQIIYSILEQEPARRWFPMAEKAQTGLLTRVPHASGLLDGTYTKDTVFDPEDHRSHRKREWLAEGLKKLAVLDFLTEELGSTIGQIAIKFALAGPMVATVLPNITNAPQLEEFAAASDTEDIPAELLDRVTDLYEQDFLVEEAQPSTAG